MLLCGVNQIVVPDKFEHSLKGFKYFIGYKSDNIIKSLCIILPEMSGFIKYFDNGGKKYVFYDWKYNENIDGNELIHNSTFNDHGKACSSCTIYIVLLAMFFIISVGINCALVHFHWYLKKSNTNITNINASNETVIY